MKRQRGRGRRPGGGGGHHQHNNNPNRALESTGPDAKVRGPASHIYERYLQLARDAASSGDRVLSENYLQHADHYFRLWRSMQPAVPLPQPGERFSESGEYEGEDEAPRGEAAEGGDEPELRGQGDEHTEAEAAQSERRHDRERDGDRRRGRGRRNRFRPEGGERDGFEDRSESAGEQDEQAARREDRFERRPREEGEAREDRRDRRPPRERDAERDAEGFSHGPKPAFLGGGD